MPTTKHIAQWRASASLSDDTAIIAFQFDDGSSTPMSHPIPSARLAAVIAVLEGAGGAYFTLNDNGTCFVSNIANPSPFQAGVMQGG